MSRSFGELVWDTDKLPLLIDALAAEAGLSVVSCDQLVPVEPRALCDARGLECSRVSLTGGTAARRLTVSAPAVMAMPEGGWIGILAGGRRLTLLSPVLERRKVAVDELLRPLIDAAAGPRSGGAERLADACGLRGAARSRAVRELIAEQIAGVKIGEVYELRSSPRASFAEQAATAGLKGRAAVFIGAHIGEILLFALSWTLAGHIALTGRAGGGWMWAWALAILTMIPLRAVTTWAQGQLAAACGGLLKQRLLAGTLGMSADAIRHEGAGRFLARVLEAEALESLALGGGLATVLALSELVVTAWVLSYSGAALFAAFLAWTLVAFLLAVRYARLRQTWTSHRLSLTCDLVERMNGHRTRLAQEPAEHRHVQEDQALETYVRHSRRMDAADAVLIALVPRGWLLAGGAVLMARFLEPAQPAALAAALGGVLLGHLAFKRLASGLAQLAGAWIAWKEVRDMFGASAGVPSARGAGMETGHGENVLEAHNLTYRYPGREAAAIRSASLRIRRGDFVLLEGESGGGKSTLSALLAGLREPDAGTLLACGADLHTLGEAGWRKRIACAPQYHENHVLSAPFAFNVLMGRGWPPRREDLTEAETICRELGLGPLLDRMPGGMWQMVGETGWQLSQGERSRLFIARALLQGGDLVVLDESFAALDPENLRQALECVFRRAETLVVVAHP